MSAGEPRLGLAELHLDGWAGHSAQRVRVVGRRSRGRVEIQAIRRTKLAGRDRWIEAGERATVPGYAVTMRIEE